MQSALATLDGIETGDVDVDYDAGTCTVNVADAKVTPAELVSAFEGTRFTAVVN